MKLTRHNGRSGKHGTYNPRHNDRRFDVENSEHIDAERARQNVYWDCYRGFTTHEFRENPEQPDFSFEEIERMYYYEHYSGHVEAQNARNEKTRHIERNRTVEDLLKNNKTCPEESIYQIGTMGESVPPDTLFSIVNEFYEEFERRFGSHIHILDWALHLDEGTPHIHERHVFDCENRYGELCPQQEKALEELGVELPDPSKPKGKHNNRKQTFDAVCRTMLFDISRKHGVHLEQEPSYGGRAYLEKQDYIRMKQKEEIAVQQEMLNQQRDKVNANHLELARQSNHVRANEKVIQSQKEKIEQQEKEFKENFISNSDRILSQGELLEEQREELQQLTLRIEDVENLLDEVSSEAYDKAVDKVAEETMRATRKDDIRLAEDSKRWIQSPERKASRKEKEYAINRLDGLIKKIEYAMEKAVVRVVRQLKQPEKKKAVVEEIKKEVKPSIREKLALNVAKIQREEAERKQLNKGRSHSSDLEL